MKKVCNTALILKPIAIFPQSHSTHSYKASHKETRNSTLPNTSADNFPQLNASPVLEFGKWQLPAEKCEKMGFQQAFAKSFVTIIM